VSAETVQQEPETLALETPTSPAIADHWDVGQTGAARGSSMGPVRVGLWTGYARFQAYLTPDQADELADALKAHAAYAREQAAEAGEEGR
jgi:hypothetical protein